MVRPTATKQILTPTIRLCCLKMGPERSIVVDRSTLARWVTVREEDRGPVISRFLLAYHTVHTNSPLWQTELAHRPLPSPTKDIKKPTLYGVGFFEALFLRLLGYESKYLSVHAISQTGWLGSVVKNVSEVTIASGT